MLRGLVDRALLEGPDLAPQATPADTLGPFAAYRQSHGGVPLVADLQRDALLADYRRRFDHQVHHDLDYTTQQLARWIGHLEHRLPQRRILRDGRVYDGLVRLDQSRRFLKTHDAWSNRRLEIACWAAIQQFYCDALALGQRLQRGERGRLRRLPRSAVRRWQPAESAAAWTLPQALMNLLEQTLPNGLHLSPLRGMWPSLAYVVSRSLLPGLSYRWSEALERLRALVSCGTLNAYAAGGPVLEVRGREALFEGGRLRGDVRHPVILAFPHRHAVLDLAILAEALKGIETAWWLNAAYFPQSASVDPRLVLIRAGDPAAVQAVLRQSTDLLAQGIPLVISVDGCAPYLMYGQQMRLKRGLRLLVDRLARGGPLLQRCALVPVTLDDPDALIRGLEPRVRVTFHPPIRLGDIPPPPDPPAATQVNFGDPLLNHLEAFFLSHSAQSRYGWWTPRVIETVQVCAARSAAGRSIGDRLEGMFHPSLFDLARMTPPVLTPEVGRLR